ncbi:MAG TPA: AarF/ABC1/UbiB kinase family protein [Solirubrobacteraceae bacterium]|jgi:predicted unusual protein kinase regulating ubiquinone biosynthesis (AarF/ABC1/UbiB family)|nr:AarF/ABC1/UbiB kinase family protein [Solirubrobacteraceae bacterium]
MAKKDAIPTSRLSRSTKVGRLAATTAAKQMGTRATNVARGDDGKQRALAKRQLETAEEIVAALGTMKGAAMKLGQVMSFLDVGLVPEEYREEFQAKLAELRDAAPKVSFKDMRKVVEGEYGERVEDVFQTFDPVPIAAASIGQVYRAKLHDGRDVAVKVQYPGVAQAVRSDMKNLGMILRLMKRVAPGLDPKALGDEIRARIDEELDYELEAQNQRTLARIYRGHPFIFVPAVVTSLSHERVIVSEFVAGRGFEELKQLPQAERDRLGEIVFRFYFGCMYRHHQFSGDPHPGNSLLLDDGRMAFLDFGLFKRIPAAVAEFELEIARLGIAGDGVALIEHLHEGGFIHRPELYTPEGILEQVHDMTWWYGLDDDVSLTPEIATEIMIEMSDPRSSHFSKMRHETLPPDHLFGRRLEMLTLAVMSQLRARGNWHRIAREWIYGDPPVTELGRLEASFYAEHPPAAVLRGAA